jgi:hypothetical protein
MIDLRKVRENVAGYQQILEKRNMKIDLEAVLALDDQRKALQLQIDQTKAEQKQFAAQQNYQAAKELKGKIQELEAEHNTVTESLQAQLLKMPNTSLHSDVPAGKDDSENVVVKVVGEKPDFDFEPLDHMTLMKKYDMVDVERGVKLGGARSYFLKGDGMLLEQAVLQYTLKRLVERGFTPMQVPNIVNPECLIGTGYFPGGEEDAYWMERDNQWLIGTSEIPVTAYHMNEILDEKDLPKKYAGFSTCYRREAGTYGKDTAGLYRVHQFQKVEQVMILPADEKMSDQYYNILLENAMSVLEDFEIPYRKLQLCT